MLLTLRHLKEDVEEDEGTHHENNEEVHDLEGKIALFFEIIPLIGNGLNLINLQSRGAYSS